VTTTITDIYRILTSPTQCWHRARQAEGDRITEDGLCLSMYRALKYQCTCVAFIKNFVEPGWPIQAASGYDLASVMHYPSRNGYAKSECNDNGVDCPIQAYLDWNDHGEGLGLLERATKPSEMDIIWVKQNYPWNVDA